MSAPVRVLIADDNPVVRLGVRAVLAGDARISLVGEAADGPAALALVRAVHPDVVLLDVRMPPGDGLSVIAGVREHAAVVMLTTSDDPETVARAVGAGADGYLVHGAYEVAELVDAVLAAGAGRPTASPVAVAALVRAVQRSEPPVRSDPTGVAAGLSTREREVLGLVAEGLTNEQIGARLGLTGKTVKNHLQAVYTKLGVHSRAAALSLWFGLADPTHERIG